MIDKKILALPLLLLLCSAPHAENLSIKSANNQASLSLLAQYQRLDYGNNPANYPLFPLTGNPFGVNFALSKTFNAWYSSLSMSAVNGRLSYNRNRNLTDAANVTQSLLAKAGYRFDSSATTALTPYLSLGYQHNQLDTGGMPTLIANNNGITQITQGVQVGLGLLAQAAVNASWVLSADLSVSQSLNTWTYAVVPINQKIWSIETNLGQSPIWRLGLSSDTKLSRHVHGLLGLQYNYSANSSHQITPPLLTTIPSQSNLVLQFSAGLGFDLDASPLMSSDWNESSSQSLYAANNQASLRLGLLFQDYGELLAGKPGYLDRQTGQIPELNMALTKTWRQLYSKLSFSESVGNTQYYGSNVFTKAPSTATTRNTMTDFSGRLGYVFSPSTNTAITPYGILGYHRWLRSVSLNSPETYHNNWIGYGILLEWAPLSRLVLSLDGNTGTTFNAQMHVWNNFRPPNTIELNESLGSRSYVQAGLGVDYNVCAKWHLLGNVDYWRFNYGASTPNAYRIYEPTSNTRLFKVSAGVGYGLD